MVRLDVNAGSGVTRRMMCWLKVVCGRLKRMSSSTAVPFAAASMMACRKEPGPLSAVVVTTNVSAYALVFTRHNTMQHKSSRNLIVFTGIGGRIWDVWDIDMGYGIRNGSNLRLISHIPIIPHIPQIPVRISVPLHTFWSYYGSEIQGI